MRLRASCVALLVVACSDDAVLGGSLGSAEPASPDAPSSGSSSGAPASSTGGVTDEGSPEPGGGADSGADPERLDVGAPPVPQGPHFVDVTVAAGLDIDPGQLYSPPFCKLDTAAGVEEGDYCIPEHFLGAAAVGDFDGDDWPDVFLTRIDGPALLMRNLGDGTFEDVAAAVGVEQTHITGGAAWLDIEGDGDLDLMTTGFGQLRHYLYINDGTGHFQERAIQHGVDLSTDLVHVGTGIGVGDYDLDGYLDMFVGDWRSAVILDVREDHNRLLHNRGAAAPGRFEDVTEVMGIDLQQVSKDRGAQPGAYGFAPAFVDLDGDHWPELALASDYGTSRLYWNDGAGHLADGTERSHLVNDAFGMGSALGDYDGDGDLDWFISSIWVEDGRKGNRLYRNDGDLEFVEVTDQKGVRNGGWAGEPRSSTPTTTVTSIWRWRRAGPRWPSQTTPCGYGGTRGPACGQRWRWSSGSTSRTAGEGW